MTIAHFLERIEEVLPPGKPLQPLQLMAYREKLSRFDDHQLSLLCESVIENCKFWPKIADLFEQARNLGLLNIERRDDPHVWQPTDCQKCVGSGLIAAFWSQEFELGPEGKVQIMRLHYLMPYHQSGGYASQRDHDDIRTVSRCDCMAGEAKTLPKGIQRWNPNVPEVIRRGWTA